MTEPMLIAYALNTILACFCSIKGGNCHEELQYSFSWRKLEGGLSIQNVSSNENRILEI